MSLKNFVLREIREAVTVPLVYRDREVPKSWVREIKNLPYSFTHAKVVIFRFERISGLCNG